MYVPKFFLRELKIIDSGFYVVVDEEVKTYDIWKEVEIEDKRRFGCKRYKEHRMVASFRYPNDEALNNLRYRKWLGRKLETAKDSKKYQEWMKRQQREAKQKKKELAIEMMAEGFMKMYQIENRRMFT